MHIKTDDRILCSKFRLILEEKTDSNLIIDFFANVPEKQKVHSRPVR